ncbi:unnamed protein product [Amoebophrya sp. A120]|nr:unnamed protein product [Amoebophrya sp. A120]|eukprot:GSA120T00018683001.1
MLRDVLSATDAASILTGAGKASSSRTPLSHTGTEEPRAQPSAAFPTNSGRRNARTSFFSFGSLLKFFAPSEPPPLENFPDPKVAGFKANGKKCRCNGSPGGDRPLGPPPVFKSKEEKDGTIDEANRAVNMAHTYFQGAVHKYDTKRIGLLKQLERYTRAQHQLEDSLRGLLSGFRNQASLNRRYDMVLPEKAMVRKAVKIYNRRVVPAACQIGLTVPLHAADTFE